MRSEPRKYQQASAIVRLHELGLTEETLARTVQVAELERRGCSSLEPSNSPGFKAWAAAVRTLGEQMIPDGWIKRESRGLTTVANPESLVAVAVVHGDDGTGLDYRTPKSKRARGAQSALFIRSNRRQLNLFVEESFVPLPADDEYTTWWLLIYSDGDSTRAELSLPVGMDEAGHLNEFEERILFRLPSSGSEPRPPGDDEEPPELHVTVVPKKPR